MQFPDNRLSLNKAERLCIYRMIEWLKELHVQHLRLGLGDLDTAFDAWRAADALESLLQETEPKVVKLRSWTRRV